MLSRSQRRVVIGAAILVLAVLFLVPAINVNRYRLSVGTALSQAIGREVSIQGVTLQTFPQPGLLLSGVVVADDPTINAEPMLRADEVLATIRLSSLWRGRLEIGSLKLRYPSVNLARSTDGRWNLESLLERVRQIPSAPTAKARPENRARFPYIEASGARINLKIGQEKKVFALNEADFSLWLASEDEWRMRLEARPIRTDANLSDTGRIKLQGAWRRASSLRDTPFQLKFWWEDGQLGQLTSLIYGRDRGWRGALRASGIIQGKSGDVTIASDARIDDFRRYDIATNEPLSLQAHCDARYSFSERQVQGLVCNSPIKGGMIQVRGTVGVAPRKNLDLSISAENIPAQFAAVFYRHAKKDVPEDMKANGFLKAAITVRTNESGARIWAGNGETSDIQIRSSVIDQPLYLGATKWRLLGPGTEQLPVAPQMSKQARTQFDLPQTHETAFAFEPISLPLGGSNASVLSGWFGREHFLVQLKGEAELERLVQIGRLFGIPTVGGELTGDAQGRLSVSGMWSGFGLPQITGSAQLNAVTARLTGVASPLRIQSAQFVADKDSISLRRATGAFVDIRSAFEFSATLPRQCVAQQSADCSMTIELRADQLDVDEINSLLNPKAQKRPWYAAIASTVLGSNRSSLPEFYAKGHFAAGKMRIKSVIATRINGNLSISPMAFKLENVNADLLGGKYVGDIAGDFSRGTPVYSSSGNFVMLGAANLAALMNDPWASGKLTASYKGTASGWNSGELLSSVKGSGNFSWRDGTLHHINLDANGRPLQFKSFSGNIEFSQGVLTISESKLEASRSIYIVSGTASLGRELEFKLARDGAPSFSISGTLQRPKVVTLKVPETQATLR